MRVRLGCSVCFFLGNMRERECSVDELQIKNLFKIYTRLCALREIIFACQSLASLMNETSKWLF
jgi:hypothetical protein